MESISLLKELVEIDSSTIEKANEVIDYLAAYLKNNGIHGKILEYKGYKSYVSTIGEGSKTLVLNGHLDVVSGKEEQFKPYIDGDRFYGRGSADMKGGVVAIVQAMIRLKKEPLNCKVMLQLVTDEEIGGFHCTRYLVEKGYIGDFVICTEPTNMTLSIQAKGIMRLDIVTNGFSAHGSRPWEGENAILKSMRNYEKIEKLPILRIGSEFYEKTSINLALIKGGDIYNRVPDHSFMGLDIRYVPHIDPEKIVKDIEEVVEGEVIVKVIEPGINVSVECEDLKNLMKVIKEVTGIDQVKTSGQHGSSDARFFTSIGVPAIEFGPIGEHWHGDSEYVTMSSVLNLENILVEYAKQFQ
ncbi:succinyl-diaminopimelate desuccinylase [Marinisporobacter balticus]|uniref:Succinyl-diaminopimelate desuccinylase n=2 Tax=Marinisporobacter balticus TaxID=2018667 RepID=A0A4R2KBC8_9FIRM|nr:succinyl-diaminopimelate desuccinylase [Marinisporobacter balticus]